MILIYDLVWNLVSNPIFWMIGYMCLCELYFLTYILDQLNREKYLRYTQIINASLASISILIALFIHFTIQPRIYGSLGGFLTPPTQQILSPFVDFGLFPGLLVSMTGIIFFISGIGILVPCVIKIYNIVGAKQFESTKLLDTGFWGIVRNPIYTSLLLIYVGFALIVGAVYSLLLTPIFAAILVSFGLVETTLNLEKTFGKERIAEYKKKVPHALINKPLWIIMIGLTSYLILLLFLGYFPLY
ncbi:MAG: methyltransferase family protein [Promethearchaeota archaeon]